MKATIPALGTVEGRPDEIAAFAVMYMLGFKTALDKLDECDAAAELDQILKDLNISKHDDQKNKNN